MSSKGSKKTLIHASSAESVVPPSPEREKGERPEKLLGKHMEAEKLSRRSSLSILRRSTNGSREHQQSKDDSKIESSSGPRSMVDTPPALSSSLPSPPTLRELAQVQAAAAAVAASPNKRRTSLSSMLLRGSTPNLNTLTTTSEKRESQSSFRHKTTAELSLSPRGTLLTDDDEDDWIEDPVNEELRRDATKMLVSDMRLTGSLGDAVANDENSAAVDLTIITDSLLELFAAENQILRLLESAISREIMKQMKTDEVNTLFRSNNLSCKLLSSFFRSECKTYLKAKIGKLVKEAVTQPSSYFEIDRSRLPGDASQYSENIEHLRVVCDGIVTSLCTETDGFPLSIRRLCWFLRSEICFHFPTISPASVNVILSGMVFLRLFCPAILTPISYGILEEFSPEANRTLLLISKVLLAAANGTQFGMSETGLAPLNEFVKAKKEVIDEFLLHQSNIPQEDVMISPSQFEAKHFRKYRIDIAMNDWIGKDSGKKGRDSLDILLRYFLQYKDTVLYYIEFEAVDKTKRMVATQSFNHFMDLLSKVKLKPPVAH